MAVVIEFDEASHEYRVNGVVVPSVTQVLSDLSAMKRLDPAMLAGAAERGKLVHRAIHLWNQNDLDEESLDDSLRPYLLGWQRFVEAHQLEVDICERPTCSLRWGVCGTPDVLGRWKQMRRRVPVLIDVKTGVHDAAHGPQTAAYVEMLREEGLIEARQVPHRAVVRIDAAGHFVVDHYFDPSDFSVFVAALTTYKFKSRHGLL